MNPVADPHGLKLNVSEMDNALDLELARSVAGYFRVSLKLADDIISRCKEVVRQWPTIAQNLRIPDREQQRMAGAFKLVD
ncbi:hypothetical protein [Thiomonas sp.]|uniref:hypothetical protein n=1 Tax=Thiomonas sp. TaxID=2047785 RepID=UPI002628FD7E|nr:hypothetical protein [Thiomonas sp.]